MMATVHDSRMNPMGNLSDEPALLPTLSIIVLVAKAMAEGRFMRDENVHALLRQSVNLLLSDQLSPPPTLALPTPLLINGIRAAEPHEQLATQAERVTSRNPQNILQQASAARGGKRASGIGMLLKISFKNIMPIMIALNPVEDSFAFFSKVTH